MRLQAHNLQPGGGSPWNRAGLTVLCLLVIAGCWGNVPLQAREPDVAALNAPQAGLPTTTMRLNGKTYWLEVAATPAQSEKGLMFRTTLPARHGMLFLFRPARPVKFWMKNTKIPLDMLFLAKGRVTFIQPDALPCMQDPCAVYGPDSPVDMVVELPAGTALKQKIGLGAQAQMSWPGTVRREALRAAAQTGK